MPTVGRTVDPATLRALAAAALAAPSADNHHRWRLRARGSELHLLLAGGGNGLGSERRRRLEWMSAGAVAETIERRAARLGWRALPGPLADGPGDAAGLSWRLSPGEPALDDPLEAAIERRHSNRRLRYGGPPLSGSRLSDWQALVASIGGQQLHWVSAGAPRRAAAFTLWHAERERFVHPELHAELYEAVRLDLPPGEPAPRGIPVHALELNAVEQAAFAASRRWTLQRTMNLFGGAAASAARSVALPVLLAPHLGVICSEDDGVRGVFDAGRALQRVWLAAASQGAAFQVFAAFPLYRLPGLSPLTTAARERLARSAARWLPSGAGAPQMVFRVGFAPPPRQVAGRPSAEGILSQAAEAEEGAHVVEVAPVAAR